MVIRAYDKAFHRGGTRAMDARKANDRIAQKAEQLRFVSRVPMLCECAEPSCRAIVMVSLPDYREVRQSDGVVVAPGHDAEGVDVGNGDRRSA